MASVSRRAFLASASFASFATQALARPRAQQLRRVGDRLFISATINGVETEALLDSAAEASFVHPSFAARAGLIGGDAVTARGSGASTIDARLVEHVRLEAAGVTVPDATVAVLDLTDIGQRLLGRELDAVLGREIFDAATLVIDIRHRWIRPLRARERPRGIELPLTEAHGIVGFPVSIEGREPVHATFDLGNGTGTLIAAAYADRVGLLNNREVTIREGGGIGGARPRRHFQLAAITIAGRTFTDQPADIDEPENADDANIGLGLLQHFRITTDYKGGRIWLEANDSRIRPSP